jgi:hypothetical protein
MSWENVELDREDYEEFARTDQPPLRDGIVVEMREYRTLEQTLDALELSV